MKQHAAVFRISRPQHGPMPTPRGLLRVLIVTLCLSLAQSFAAVAQTNAPAPLPPAAQEALNKGIIAAKVPDYLLAIRYFEEARKQAPQAPVVFLNMGLAESRIPGRELRAMAWFGAYLAAYPDAPNAAAVKEQIAVLDIRNQSNTSRFLKTVQDAASQLSVDMGKGGEPNLLVKGYKLSSIAKAQIAVAKAQIESGDIASAQKTFVEVQRTAEMIQVADWKRVSLEAIASAQVGMTEAQLKAGDVSGARKNADLILDTDWKSNAMRAIARAQIKMGDFTGAQKTADLLHPQWKGQLQSAIAAAQAKADIANVLTTPQQLTSVTQIPILPVIPVSDWLRKLDDDNKGNDCPLNAGPFLDLAGYLKSLPPSDDPAKVFDSLYRTAMLIIDAQNVITGMLKQQAKP